MVRKCVYKGCKNVQKRGCNISFHLFPKTPENMSVWLKASGNSMPTGLYMYICSEHFVGGQGPSTEHSNPIVYSEVHSKSTNQTSALPLKSPKVIRRTKKKKVTAARRTAALSLLSLYQDTTIERQDVSEGVSLSGEPIVEKEYSYKVTPVKIMCKKRIRTPGSTSSPRKKRAVFHPKRYPWELMIPCKTTSAIDFDEGASFGCKTLDIDDAEGPIDECVPVQAKRKLKLSDVLCDRPPRTVPDSVPYRIRATTQQENSTSAFKVNASVQCNLDTPCLSYDRCKKMPENKFCFFTGVTQTNFEIIYEFVGGDEVSQKLKYNYGKQTPKKSKFSYLSPRDKLFMTLIRLRRGIHLKDLGYLFNVSAAYASNVFFTWIRFLALSFRNLKDVMCNSAVPEDLIPKCFKPFRSLRAIVDCFEIRIQKPYHFRKQGNTFSAYKYGNTVKFFLAMSVLGFIWFISEGHEGRISDRQIVLQSGFLEHLNPRDSVMADRGFRIEADLNEVDVELLIPPFLGSRKKMTAREVVLTKAIASSRVHVERAIGKLKEFRLIRYTVPNTMIPILSDIVFVCCCLVNFLGRYIDKPVTEDHEM